ncbi:hypothetical protein HY993_01325 [Candidatus Micrarchaeota archaeon]|nr:hypothetical protein [Candidatus Micrarchaeota archaeon]
MSKTIVEFELAEDLKELIAYNPDVQVSPTLKNEIIHFPNMAVIKTEKTIASPLQIISATLVDDQFVEDNFQ